MSCPSIAPHTIVKTYSNYPLMDLKSIRATVQSYQNELDGTTLGLEAPLLQKLRFQRIHDDLPVLLHHLKGYESNKLYQETLTLIQHLFGELSKLLLANEEAMSNWIAQFAPKETPSEVPSPSTNTESVEESYASLRNRLLAGGVESSKLENASHEQLNSYHESIQEDLISELSDLTSSLKISAMQLSSKITADAKLVSETTEHMVKNLSLMQNVGRNLNDYLGSKTGGKISLFFMIKIMIFVFVLFFFMAFVAKFFPKM